MGREQSFLSDHAASLRFAPFGRVWRAPGLIERSTLAAPLDWQAVLDTLLPDERGPRPSVQLVEL